MESIKFQNRVVYIQVLKQQGEACLCCVLGGFTTVGRTDWHTKPRRGKEAS
jgi:hypothetical protein